MIATGVLLAPVGTSVSTAAVDPACATPVLRETMINQGLPRSTSLARGKAAVAKFFLSLPNGCDPNKQYLRVTSGVLSVLPTGAAAPTKVALPTQSYGPIAPYGSAPSNSSTGNPTFLVPGAGLGPTGAGAPYTVSFTATIKYVVTEVTALGTHVSYPETSFTTSAVSRTVDVASNPLRLLVVPMGNADAAFGTSFPAAAATAVDAAMLSLNRMLPVADGTGPLSHPTAGVRYNVAPSDSLVDLGLHDHDSNPATAEVNWMPTGKYCGTASHFDYISRKLAEAREKWNSIPGNAPASRVLGVVWNDISLGASSDEETPDIADGGCVEGAGEVAGTLAWSRLVDPHPGNTAPSGGAIAAMEVMHTLGAVPNALVGYHSTNSQADGTSPDRGYDSLRASYIRDDKSVMKYDFDAWHDDNTLLEPGDWTQASCVLSANAAQSLTATACSEPATVGAVAAGASEHLHLAGRTDGTAAGTKAHTYVGSSRARDLTDPSSPYKLVYRDGNGAELGERRGVRVTFTTSRHEHDGSTGNHIGTTGAGIFDVAIEAPAGSAEFELVKVGSPDVVLYGRARNARPVIDSVSRPENGAQDPERYADGPDPEEFFVPPVDSVLSDDGALVAWEVERGVHVRAANDPGEPFLLPLAADPSFAHTSNALIYTADDGQTVAVADFGTGGGTPQAATVRTLYTAPRDPFGNLTDPGPVSDPSFSPGDDAVVLAAGSGFQSQLYVLQADAPCTSLLTDPDCVRLTTDAHASAPSWSAAAIGTDAPQGLIAFTDATPYDGGSSSAVSVINPAAPAAERTVLADDAAQPDWGGDRLAFWDFNVDVTVEEVVTALVQDGALVDLQRVTSSNGHPSLSADDRHLSFSRIDELGATGLPASAVYLLTLPADDGARTVEVSDDNPDDLRLDVVGVCTDATYPLLTNVLPTPNSDGPATFQVHVETESLCVGGQVRFDLTDGFQVAEPYVDPTLVGSSGTPTVAVVSPRNADTFLQHRAVPLSLNGRDAAGRAVDVSYTLTGPGGTSRQGVLAAGQRMDLAAFTSAGSYTLTATTTDPSGGTHSVTSVFAVLADADADGLPASIDSSSVNPCLPLNADADPRTAVVDYDGDHLTGPDDRSPCTSALNAIVDFDANTIQPLSNGAKCTVYITSTAVDLRLFSAKNVAITRLAGHHVHLPALKYEVDVAGRATAQFDRQKLHELLAKHNLKGYVPVLVTGAASGKHFGGIDPTDPTVM